MKQIGLLIAFFAALFLVLPGLTAQDEKKKDPDKAEKKDEPKKDDAKKDEPKKDDEPKKEKPKKEEPKKEKLEYGSKFVTKIISANGRDLTVEVKEVDPKKQQDVQNWSAQQMVQLGNQAAQVQQQFAQANMKTKPNERASALQNAMKTQANYQTALAKYQIELAKKDIYTPKPYDFHAQDEVKVRAMVPPVEFDDLGFEKKFTKKELEERKDKTGLPGYPSDFDQIKTGQYVEIYLAKTAKDKDQPKKKKGPDDDPPPDMKARPDVVMIVILQQPPQPK